jgi:hypothetical protein
MLQKRFKREATHSAVDEASGETSSSFHRKVVASNVFTWGISPAVEHPKSIGKWDPHTQIQNYEAPLPYMTGMVLNIFSKVSNGDGGLLIALEVPSPCGSTDDWVEVDRSRCSRRYPCAIRLPAGAVRGNEAEPTKFRTRVLTEDEDYLTDFLEYERITLDHDAEAVLAQEHYTDGRIGKHKHVKKVVQFSLSPALASGALYVTPVVTGPTSDTMVTMRIRQPEPKEEIMLTGKSGTSKRKVSLQQHDSDAKYLEHTLRSYRSAWAKDWRAPKSGIGGCDISSFEVVAEQLYPGEVEVELWVAGDKDAALTDILVTTRASWAEAEVAFLDTVMKDHFAFFNDPDEIVHGLPLDALKKDNPRELTDSNPCEWGYAMESWIIMVETGAMKDVDAVKKLQNSFTTLETLQQDPNQFAHGLFYPYYTLLAKDTGKKQFPQRTAYAELPCGDDALFYASLMLVQGWLESRSFKREASQAADILGRMDFSHCIRKTDCNAAGNGLETSAGEGKGDKFWSVPLTVNAETMAKHPFNWNVWADEGGLVAMIVTLTGAANDTQYESIVRQQHRYSPCTHWEGITVGHTAFFNSVFTLPTRSMLGFGTLFASPYYHEFAVRSVLPAFRAFQKLKRKLGVDYMGPSDAMSMMPKAHPGKFYGSYAYWPPNNMYDCRKGKSTMENQCTWCKGIQYEGLDDPFDMVVPHGSMASFLVAAMMEKSQFTAWIEDTKRLVTDWSEVYKPGYGLEVLAPARRTPRGGKFDGAYNGRGIWESLSHGYTVLSMYEGLATMRRRFELIKKEKTIPGNYEPPDYKPLSDFVDMLPKVRAKINKRMETARAMESTERQCAPSDYGPAGFY